MSWKTLGTDWLDELVEIKKLKPAQRDDILREKRNNPAKKIFDILLDREVMPAEKLTQFISKQIDLPYVEPAKMKIPAEVLKAVAKDVAKRYQLIPIKLDAEGLTVAISNPEDPFALDDLCMITGLRLFPQLASPDSIQAAIEKFYDGKGAEAAQAEAEGGQDDEYQKMLKEDDKDSIEFIKSMNEELGGDGDAKGEKVKAVDLAKAAGQTTVVKMVNLMLVESIKRRASDLFIEPWEKHMRIRVRVDGLLEEVKSIPATMSMAMASRIKVMCGLDIAERRMPQDGRFRAKIENREVDFRVSVLPTSHGEKVCIRLLDKTGTAQNLEKLGFEKRDYECIMHALDKPHGMILVTGPTGSGKTTTLYAVLNKLHTIDVNITTVEDPVEYQMHGINQVNIKEAVGLTFVAALRSILRQDPDIVMIGEIRDLETMDIAVKAALTGHLVLSTLHTNDACSSVVRMMNMGIEPFLITSSVLIVTAQRLLRKLCDNCKEVIQADPEILKDMKIKTMEGIPLYKPVGCPACRNTGYAGRLVITEVLDLTLEIRRLILLQATADKIKNLSRKQGMVTLRECGIQKVIKGLTTLEEVMRVTTLDPEIDPADEFAGLKKKDD